MAIGVIAETTGSGFNTDDGTNIDPSTPFGPDDDQLTVNRFDVYDSTADGKGGSDTIVVNDRLVDFRQMSLVGFENLTLENLDEGGTGIPVFFSVGQYLQFTTENSTIIANGYDTITLYGDGNFSTADNIEIYYTQQANGGERTITVNHSDVAIYYISGSEDQIFDLGSITFRGSIGGNEENPGSIRATSGASIVDATIDNIANLSLSGELTLTVDQANNFSGEITASGSNDAFIFGSDEATLSGENLGEIERFETAADGQQQIVSLSSTVASGKRLRATDSDDAFSVTGAATDDILQSIAGDNEIDAGAGDDVVREGQGNEVITLGEGEDTIVSQFAVNFDGDTITDLSTEDSIRLISASSDLDARFVQNGAQLEIFIPDQRVFATINTPNAIGRNFQVTATEDGSDLVLSFEEPAPVIIGNPGQQSFYLTAGEDLRIGTAGDDRIFAYGGDDTIWAGPDDEGDDEIFAGNGNDVVGGGAGDDQIDGSSGDDTLWGGTGSDELSGGDGNDVVGGGDDDDDLVGGAGSDALYGGQDDGADTIFGGDDADTIYAGRGQDVIDGGNDDDLIFNGGGRDTVDGGNGADLLWGGEGDDVLTGGDGADVFAFVEGNGADTVTDYTNGEDEIRFEDVDEQEISITDTDAGVEISFGEGRVILEGVSASQIDTGDFIFT